MLSNTQESSLPIPSSYPEKHRYFAFAELFIYIPAHNNRRQLRSITSFASVPEAARTHVFVRTCESKM